MGNWLILLLGTLFSINLNFGLSSSDSEEFKRRSWDVLAEANGQSPFVRTKSTRDTCKFPEYKEEKLEIQVKIPYNGEPTPSGRVEIYAHRTGRGLAAENTLDGCDVCIELGVDYIDFDIAITKDGVLVVTHDTTLNPDLTRDENGIYLKKKIPIRSLTLEQLQRFNVGKINPTSRYAAYFPDQIASEHASIPTLKEAIEYVKARADYPIGFQIEIKTYPGHTPSPKVYAKALNRVLEETNILARTEVQSYNFPYLIELRKLNPQIKTSFVTEGRFSPKTIYSLKGNCWSVFEMDATESNVKQAQAMGIKVLAWGYPEREGTEFNDTQIQKLIDWGVDGIITDRPDKLKKLLLSPAEGEAAPSHSDTLLQ